MGRGASVGVGKGASTGDMEGGGEAFGRERETEDESREVGSVAAEVFFDLPKKFMAAVVEGCEGGGSGGRDAGLRLQGKGDELSRSKSWNWSQSQSQQ